MPTLVYVVVFIIIGVVNVKDRTAGIRTKPALDCHTVKFNIIMYKKCFFHTVEDLIVDEFMSKYLCYSICKCKKQNII